MIDASALLAMLLNEPGAEEIAKRISVSNAPFTSPLAIYEAVVRLMNVRGVSAARAEADVRQLLAESRCRIVDVSDATASLAVSAFDRYGRGRHPAKLNFGDCFAYACARAHGAALIYKGDDFAKTDLG